MTVFHEQEWNSVNEIQLLDSTLGTEERGSGIISRWIVDHCPLIWPGAGPPGVSDIGLFSVPVLTLVAV